MGRMLTVRITREAHSRDDVRTPFFVQLSRVPLVGEWVSLPGQLGEARSSEIAGTYRVMRVQHLTDSAPEVAAILRVRRVRPEEEDEMDRRCLSCRRLEPCVVVDASNNGCGGWRPGAVWGGNTWRAGLSGRR